MKLKHIVAIINEAADGEKFARTPQEFVIPHSVYLDAQDLHKARTGHYLPRRRNQKRIYYVSKNKEALHGPNSR